MKTNSFLFLLLQICILQATAQAPIASYPFTSDVSDASGNGYNGTLHGNATATDTLTVGDNATDYVSLPDGLLAGLNDLTISFMVKFNSIHTGGGFPANTVMHVWGSNNQDELKLSYNHDASVFQVAVKTNQPTFPFVANANQWYCFNIVRSNNQISVYIDGSQVGTTQSSAAGSLSPAVSGFVLGQEEDCTGGCFASNQSLAGKLDELKFYNYAFTPDQATEACITCGPKLFYPFTFGASDSSGNNLSGTLNGNASVSNGILSIGDNASDHVAIPDAALASLQDFDISFAVKFDTLHEVGSFPANTILHAWGVFNQDELKISHNESLHSFQVNVKGIQPVFDFFPNTGEWYCFHIQRKTDSLLVYKNGQLMGVGAVPADALQIAGGGIEIGQEQDCLGGCFVANQSLSGSIDNFRISNCALPVPTDEGCNIEIGISSPVQNPFSIFPNPADDNARINFPAGKNTRVRLLNELGQEVLIMQPTNSSSLTIPLKNVASGIYLVEVQSENQLTQTEKLLIKH